MKKRFIIKFLIGIFGIILALFLAIFIGGFFYIQSDHARKQIQPFINKQINGTIEWEKQKLSLFNARITINQLMFFDGRNERIAMVDELMLDFLWSDLLSGGLGIESLKIINPSIDLIADQNGTYPFEKISLKNDKQKTRQKKESKNEKSSPFLERLTIEDIIVSGGKFNIENYRKNQSVLMEDVTVKGRVDLSDKRAKLILEIENLSFRSGKRAGQYHKLSLLASLDKETLDQIAIQLHTPISKVQLKGKINHIFTAPDLDLSMDMDLGLPDVQKAIGLDLELSGMLESKIRIHGLFENPELMIQGQYGGGRIGRYPIEFFQFDLNVDDKVLDLKKFLVESSSGVIYGDGSLDMRQAFPNGFLHKKRNLDASLYRINIFGKNIRLDHLMEDLQVPLERFDSKLTFHGQGFNPKTAMAKMSLEVSGERIKNRPKSFSEIEIKAQAGLTDGIVSFEDIKAAINNNFLTSSGKYNLLSGDLFFNTQLKFPELGNLMPLIPIENNEHISGQLDVIADISGSITRPVFAFKINGKRLRHEKIDADILNFQGNFDQDGKLKIREFFIQHHESNLSASGEIHLFDMPFQYGQDKSGSFFQLNSQMQTSLSARFNGIEIKNFIGSAKGGGKIDGDLILKGKLKYPEASVHIRGTRLFYNDFQLGNLDGHVNLSEGIISSDAIILKNKGSVVKLSGKAHILNENILTTFTNPEIHLNLYGNSVAIQDFKPGLEGKCAFNAKLDGRMKQLNGSAFFEASDLKSGIRKVDHIQVEAKFEDNKVWINPFEILVRENEMIEGNGWIDLQKGFQYQVASQGVAFEHILDEKRMGDLTGRIEFTSKGHGTLTNPIIKSNLKLTDIKFKNQDVKDVFLDFDVKNQRIRISGIQDFELKGTVDFDSKEFEAFLSFDQMKLDPYFFLINQNNLTGTVSGKVKASGNLINFNTLSAAGDISILKLFFQNEEILKTENFNLSLDDREFIVKNGRFDFFREGRLDIAGKGSFEGPLNFQINGQVPLEMIHLLNKNWPVMKGSLDLSARINGTNRHPEVLGDIRLSNFSCNVPYINQNVKDVNGTVQFGEKGLDVSNLNGKIGEGNFYINGGVQLNNQLNPEEFSFNLKGYRIPILIPDTADIHINTHLKFSGRPKASDITGEVKLVDGIYYKDVEINLINLVNQKKRNFQPKQLGFSLPLLEKVNLDVLIQTENPFEVENNIAKMSVRSLLKLSGPTETPVISGRSQVESGNISISSTVFDIKRGIIDFINPYRIEPDIDIHSEVNINNYTILLKITGVLENLEVELLSEPPESRNNILSLLLTGKTVEELRAGKKGQSVISDQLISDILLSKMSPEIKKRTGIDSIEVASGEDPAVEGGENVQITIGKDLSKRLTFRYSLMPRNGATVQRRIAEYKIIENFILDGFQASDGNFGGGFKLRLQFR